MTPIKIKVRDSIALTAIQTDKFKTGVLSVSLRTPLTRKNTAHNAVLSGVMRRGTVNYPSTTVLNKALDELYASNVELKNSRCGKNCLLTVTAEVLDGAYVTDGTDVLGGTARIMSELLLAPLTENGVFVSGSVIKEKMHVCDAIKAEINNPKAYAADRCAELLHRNDADFSTLEELFEDVDKITPTSLYEYYKELISSSALTVYYVGSEAPERVAALIDTHFGAFSGKSAPPSPIASEPCCELVERTEQMKLTQGKLALGFRVGVTAADKEYFAAVLFNEIFGGSPASKLFMNVREKMSLCYYCGSRYDTYMGNVTVSAGINVSDKDTAYSAILAQLDDIKNGNISEAELTAAKKSIEHSYRQIYDYPIDLISFYSNKAIFGIDADPVRYRESFDKVSAKEIIAVAKKIQLDSVFFLEGTLDGIEPEEDLDE